MIERKGACGGETHTEKHTKPMRVRERDSWWQYGLNAKLPFIRTVKCSYCFKFAEPSHKEREENDTYTSRRGKRWWECRRRCGAAVGVFTWKACQSWSARALIWERMWRMRKDSDMLLLPSATRYSVSFSAAWSWGLGKKKKISMKNFC